MSAVCVASVSCLLNTDVSLSRIYTYTIILFLIALKKVNLLSTFYEAINQYNDILQHAQELASPDNLRALRSFTSPDLDLDLPDKKYIGLKVSFYGEIRNTS